MDTDEGDEDDPISLHKYLYAEADPIDNTDPSGNDSVSDTLDAVTMTIVPGAVTHPLAYKSFNVAAFAQTLDSNASLNLKNGGSKGARVSISRCAQYVRLALAAGGIVVSAPDAKDYLTILPVVGFQLVAHTDSDPGYVKTKGDIAVFNLALISPHRPIPKNKKYDAHIHGHIEGYDGGHWVSDFIQRSFIPYGTTPAGPSNIYRYPLVSGN